MTPQEIQERNIEIAKMICKYDEESLRYIFKNKMWNNFTYGVSERHHQEQLCFHVNYDWLMEAVEFIENKLKLGTVISNMGFGINNQYININRGVSIVDETIDNPSKIMGKSSTKKEAVFIAVSDFAKLYNNKEL